MAAWFRKKNVGTADRIARLTAGLALAALGLFYLAGIPAAVMGVASLPLLGSGATGICPGYSLLGLSTQTTRR